MTLPKLTNGDANSSDNTMQKKLRALRKGPQKGLTRRHRITSHRASVSSKMTLPKRANADANSSDNAMQRTLRGLAKGPQKGLKRRHESDHREAPLKRTRITKGTIATRREGNSKTLSPPTDNETTACTSSSVPVNIVSDDRSKAVRVTEQAVDANNSDEDSCCVEVSRDTFINDLQAEVQRLSTRCRILEKSDNNLQRNGKALPCPEAENNLSELGKLREAAIADGKQIEDLLENLNLAEKNLKSDQALLAKGWESELVINDLVKTHWSLITAISNATLAMNDTKESQQFKTDLTAMLTSISRVYGKESFLLVPRYADGIYLPPDHQDLGVSDIITRLVWRRSAVEDELVTFSETADMPSFFRDTTDGVS